MTQTTSPTPTYPTTKDVLAWVEVQPGWTKGGKCAPFKYSHQKPSGRWEQLEIPLKTARNNEKGVFIRWFECTRKYSVSKPVFNYNSSGYCASSVDDTPHVHLQVKARSETGGIYVARDFFLLKEGQLDDVVGKIVGHPPVAKVTKKNLPDPHEFSSSEFEYSERHMSVRRKGQCTYARLVGPVGIDPSGKVNEGVAQLPGEEVWFHFDCEAPSGATFDVITDGEKFHPLNRRTKRVSKNMTPKDSVDLRRLNVADRDLFCFLIHKYAEMVNG